VVREVYFSMAVLFGDLREDGLVRVWRTLHNVDGKEVLAKDYPDGYEFDKLPENPQPKKGIDHIMYYNPKDGKFIWEEEERPLNQEEIMLDLVETNKGILDTLTKLNSKLEVK